MCHFKTYFGYMGKLKEICANELSPKSFTAIENCHASKTDARKAACNPIMCYIFECVCYFLILIAFNLSGSDSSKDDRSGKKRRIVGHAAELSLGCIVDDCIGKDL